MNDADPQQSTTLVAVDDALVERAQRALGASSAQAAVEEALRRAATGEGSAESDGRDKHRRFLNQVEQHADLAMLRSDQMWR